ncbi:MAG TPA: P-II family nitrogen regulator [Thermoguttaceae bacterium]|nr:P-II family nitrogen regulator [Thermoguttaceae bacterium]
MKEVLAVIRMNKMNETKRALADAGIVSATARKVMGRGKGKVDFLLLKGAQEGYEEAINQLAPGPKLIPKRMLTIVVPDEFVKKTVETIIDVNKTGSPGDGKVFVMPLRDAIRVRTGETGQAALDEMIA